MKIKLQVTEEDIKNGERESETNCPIALALLRAAGKVAHCSVEGSGSEMKLYLPDGTYIQDRDDKEIDYFISTFDVGLKVEPFEKEIEFELYMPDNFGE